jgi:hypothetical protein
MSTVKDTQERATRIALKEDRARDAARALQEREAERKAAIVKTARLRALRLAKADTAPVKAPKSK